MKQPRTVIVTPRIPPLICGVGDYSWKLGELLSEKVDVQFLVTDPANPPEPVREGSACPVIAVPPGRPLAPILENHADVVLLQFAQYDYHDHGHPNELVEALVRWKASQVGRRLVTMVHELWAPSLPRRREVLRYPLQYWVHRKLFRNSDTVFVNNRRSWNKVSALRGRPPEKLLPVFSNFGEPQWNEQQWQERPANSWVIFGSAGRNLRSLRSFVKLFDSRTDLKIDHLSVVGGQESPEIRALLGGLPIQSSYSPTQPVSMIQSILRRCQVGYLDYDVGLVSEPSLILKSTVFASMLAYGLLPAVPDSAAHAIRSQGFHILDHSAPMNMEQRLHAVSENRRTYQAQFSLAQCASSYLSFIESHKGY